MTCEYIVILINDDRIDKSELYEKYNLTDEEINFIESMIRPMDLGGDNNG